MIGNKRSIQQQTVDGLLKGGAQELPCNSPTLRVFRIKGRKHLFTVNKDGRLAYAGFRMKKSAKAEVIRAGIISLGEPKWLRKRKRKRK